MSGTLQGTGATAFERVAGIILNKVSPGTTALPASFFKFEKVTAAFNGFTQQQITHRTGKQLIMCGVTTVGVSNHVCGR